MRAIVVTRHGGPEVLELEDAARAQADVESRATTGKLILTP